MRIAIAGLAHEALTFFPEPTRMADFDLWEGDEILGFPGVEGLAAELDIELVSVLIAQTRSPGGCVRSSLRPPPSPPGGLRWAADRARDR